MIRHGIFRRRWRALAVALVFGSAWFGGRAVRAETEPPTVVFDEYSFTPAAPVLPGGGVRLLLVNQGLRRHNLTLLVDGQPQESPYLRPGETVVWEPQVAESGIYQFFCNEYRHLEKGMSGELTVE